MRRFSQLLLSDMERQLSVVHGRVDDPVKSAEEAIKISIVILERLKTFSVKYRFPTKAEEVEFFRDIKPQFAARLIYYNEVYNIEVSKPAGAVKEVRKHYKSQLAKLKSFFDDNLDFYKYYRTGNRELDAKYFIRGRFDVRLTLDSAYFQADNRFSTSHDYKVARILANDLIKQYLESHLYRNEINTPMGHTLVQETTKWTAPKVALVELIYALHAQGAINNGASDLQDIARFFEKAFNLELGQFHKTFLEIRERKADRTKFLNALKEKLLRRMDEADEN